MKIVHFSSWDLRGGAARSAYRLHQSLLQFGSDSRMAVLSKSSADQSVHEFRPSTKFSVRLRRGLRRRYLNFTVPDLPGSIPGRTIFTDCRSQYCAEPCRMASGADIAHIHWVAGFLDPRYFLSALNPEIPVVWTLHDMNPFTGGCHYASDCDNFTRACGQCPQLDSHRARDRSHRIWAYKRSAFLSRGTRMFHIVAPSRWLAREAGRSSLLKDFPISVIPYSLDTRIFQPRPREVARARFGLPPGTPVICFVADSAGEERKGLAILSAALQRLADHRELRLLVLGKNMSAPLPRDQTVHLDFLDDEEALSYAYSAADIFVLPSLQDNLPNTALEALSCGVPIVGSRVGGVPEIVRDELTGSLFESGNAESLAIALRSLLASPDKRLQMSAESRRIALQDYDLQVQARRYNSLYKELISSATR